LAGKTKAALLSSGTLAATASLEFQAGFDQWNRVAGSGRKTGPGVAGAEQILVGGDAEWRAALVALARLPISPGAENGPGYFRLPNVSPLPTGRWTGHSARISKLEILFHARHAGVGASWVCEQI